MITVKPNGVRVLIPDTTPYLTNGETYSERVVLGINADASVWREASQEEYDEYLARKDDPDEEEITAEEAFAEIEEVLGYEA